MKITRFEEFIERSVPYFIGILLLAILLILGSCDADRMQKQIKDDRESVWVIIEKGGCEYLVSANAFDDVPPVHHAKCKNHKPCE